MFFRRKRPKVTTFADRVSALTQAGFGTEQQAQGRVKVSKHGIGAIIGDSGEDHPYIERAGVLVGPNIAVLVNAGYQMFLELQSGQRLPATSEQLQNLHEFEEDAKDALGLTHLYNTSLGTTTRKHMYDRVFKRDSGTQPKPWEKKDKAVTPPHTKGSLPL